MMRLLILVLQIMIGILLVFPGLDLAYMIVQPMSSNWMWLAEMKYSFVGTIGIIIVHFLTGLSGSIQNFAVAALLLVVVVYLLFRAQVFPYRALFLFVTYSTTVLLMYPFQWVLAKQSTNNRK